MPAAQMRQTEAPAAEYLPAAHKVQTEAPLAEYMPASQLAQTKVHNFPSCQVTCKTLKALRKRWMRCQTASHRFRV